MPKGHRCAAGWRPIWVLLASLLLAACGADAPPAAKAPEIGVVKVVQRDTLITQDFVGQTRGSTDIPSRARVGGFLESRNFIEGRAVEKGQLLFELYSPTLVNAQQEYLATLASGNDMLQSASRDRLAALGVTGSEIERLQRERTASQRVRVYAEADGVIAHLGVREGIFVTPATEVMSVARLDRVWVLAEVFERQAAWVAPGQQAEVELDYLPGRKWQGTVDYVYPELDATTRTLKVRIRFNNEGEVLRPNMFARVTLLGTATEPVVHVPREALIRGGDVDRVVLSLGDGRFRSQEVEIGIESGDRIAILEGLSAGDRIVTSGQFLIDSESDIESGLSRMDDHGAEQ